MKCDVMGFVPTNIATSACSMSRSITGNGDPNRRDDATIMLGESMVNDVYIPRDPRAIEPLLHQRRPAGRSAMASITREHRYRIGSVLFDNCRYLGSDLIEGLLG